MTDSESPRSLRRAYLEWVEEQVEAYKDSVPRGDLLRMADEVVEELRVSDLGQYQLTELLLCTAIDRKIIRMLKLPGYRAWCNQRERARLRVQVAAPSSSPPPVVFPVPVKVKQPEVDGAMESVA
ncbi:MAG TPA: hypothetical protein VHG28_03190 [Longimicrobiaceae bacterium]|nr:hypothetical protein [Longimicrobiaceae bacterium]